MKKLIFISLFFISGICSATEFLGIKLENTTKTELNNALKKDGAILHDPSSTDLVNIFIFKNSSIPHAVNAITYWNEKKEFLGLKIGFGYSGKEISMNNLKEQLVEKYGQPASIKKNSPLADASFKNNHFSGVAIWNLGDINLTFNNSIYFSNYEQTPFKGSVFANDVYSIQFKHIKRYEQVKSNLTKSLKEQDLQQWKGKF